MSRIAFIKKELGLSKMSLISRSNTIIDHYQSQGFRLTLRQLFYQLISRVEIPNTERSYKNLGEAISDGRLVGLLDWDAIEDRIRVPRTPQEFSGLQELAEVALQTYRLPRWAGQPYYVELWVEKDALAGVLESLANQYHVTLMVNRGYSSQSAMYEASKRFIQAEALGKSTVLLYLGDHDPSGEDMVRDIDDRLRMFGVDSLQVRKIALTTEQVSEYNPPPNPAKLTDSRAAGYIAQHGPSSWEVDALPPETLQEIVKNNIAMFIKLEEMKKVLAQEKRDKAALKKAVGRLNGRKS